MWTKDKMPDLSGKTVMVTGANTGIGYETALAFYESGAQVILACRNTTHAEEALKRMKARLDKGTLEVAVLDLSSLEAIKNFSQLFLKNHSALHLLINNAGVMYTPPSKTKDGYELQFGVNFLGHYALTGHLYPLLQSTPGSRVVTVSSMALLHGVIDFDNLKSEKDYNAQREYCQSKLANVMFAAELQRRIVAKGDRVISVAAQPGANKTDIARYMSAEAYQAAVDRVGELMEPWQGALPSLYAAVSEEVIPGLLYGPDQDGGYRGYPALHPLEAKFTDEMISKQLWQQAEKATGVVYP